MMWLPDEDQAADHRIEALCAVTGCKRERAGRWTVCGPHGEDVGQWLAAIPDDILDRLDASPSMQAPVAGEVHGGGLKSHRSVGNLDVMTLRDPRSSWRNDHDPDGNNLRGVLAVLHAIASRVREARNLFVFGSWVMARFAGQHGPVCPAPCGHTSCDRIAWWYEAPWRPTVSSERQLLRDHLDWCLGQDFAATMWAELRQVTEQIERLRPPAGGETARPRAHGICADCGGQLWTRSLGGGEPMTGWCEGPCGRQESGLNVLKMTRKAGAA